MTTKLKKIGVVEMRDDGVNRLSAKSTKILLSKQNLNCLTILDNRRDIRKAVVNKLLRVLEEGKHFETPLMTNKVKDKHRLLDGNHRKEAIECYLQKHPNRKVEISIFYYDGLTPKQEKEMYTKWNLGTKQNTNDFVKQYWNNIPLTQLMTKKDFPYLVNHVWSNKAIEFKSLVAGYLTIYNEKFCGGFSGSAMAFIKKSQELDMKDYNKIKAFLSEYISIFGLPNKKNPHYKQAVFYSLYRIWLDNHKKVNPERMKNAFIRLRGHERVIYYQSWGGTREVTIRCRFDLLSVINGNRKNPIFL